MQSGMPVRDSDLPTPSTDDCGRCLDSKHAARLEKKLIVFRGAPGAAASMSRGLIALPKLDDIDRAARSCTT